MSGEPALEGVILDVLAAEMKAISDEIGSDRAASTRLGISNTTIGKAKQGQAGLKVLRAVLDYRGLKSAEELLQRHPRVVVRDEPPPPPDEEDGLPDYRNFILTKRHFADLGVNVPDHIYEAVRPMRAYEGGKRTDIDIQLWISAVEDMLRNYDRAITETRAAMLKRLGGTDLLEDDEAVPRIKVKGKRA
jgi:hypothetical protein